MKSRYIDYKNNQNYRNNQNYVLSNIDKRFILYSFFEYKNREVYIKHIIFTIGFVVLLPIGLFIWTFGGIDNLLMIVRYLVLIGIGLFVLWGVGFFIYMLIMIINYQFLMKLIKKYRFIFRKKSIGIVLRKKPVGKYFEVMHYFTINEKNRDYFTVIGREIKEDFIYILK